MIVSDKHLIVGVVFVVKDGDATDCEIFDSIDHLREWVTQMGDSKLCQGRLL